MNEFEQPRKNPEDPDGKGVEVDASRTVEGDTENDATAALIEEYIEAFSKFVKSYPPEVQQLILEMLQQEFTGPTPSSGSEHEDPGQLVRKTDLKILNGMGQSSN